MCSESRGIYDNISRGISLWLQFWVNKIIYIFNRFNIAEAVNFALERWLEVGVNAESCRCRRDSVRIDMHKFIDNVNEHKRRRKILKPTEKNVQNWIKCEHCDTWRKISKSKFN